jgi:hypothetical protein
MSLLKIKPFSIDTVDTFTFGNANVTGNLVSGNASLGNLTTANFFQGNGSLLTSLTGANVSGQVANALVAGTVYTAAQTNITSLGTLTGLTSGGTVNLTTASNVTLGPVANIHISGGSNGYFLSTDGSGTLSWSSASAGTGNANIAGSNTQVFFNDNGSGTLGAKSTFTFDKGTDTLTVSKISANGALLTSIVGANVDGNVTGAVQSHYANIANSVSGTNVSGNVTSAVQSHFANTANAVAWSGVSSTPTSISGYGITDAYSNTNAGAYLTSVTFTTTGNITANVITATTFSGNGSGISYVTGTSVSGNVTSAVQSHYANIANSVAGANVSGQVANANLAYFESVTTQTTGTFYPVFVSGNANGNYALASNTALSFDAATGVLTTGTIQSGGGSGGNITGANLVSANYFTGNGSLLTSITGANVSGNVTSAVQSHYANIANSVSGTNVSGNVTSAVQSHYANIANAVAWSGVSSTPTSISGYGITDAYSNTNAGAYLTSYTGNLAGNNLTLTGNLVITGTTTSVNSTVTRVVDPIFELGGGANGAALSADDNKDRGVLLHYYSGSSAVDAFMGWDDSNVEFVLASNVSITNEVVTYNAFGNLRLENIFANNANFGGVVFANGNISTSGSFTGNLVGNVTGNISGTVTVTGGAGAIQFANAANALTSTANLNFDVATNTLTANNFSGNGSLLTSITGSNVSGNVSFAVTSNWSNVANSVSGTNVSGNVSSAVQSHYANIANSVSGTNVSGNVSSAVQSHYANIANSVSGTNVSGQVANALVAGTVYTGAQPNITSLGTLANLTVSGATNLGNVANVTITGGSANYFLKTDGAGVLSFASVPTTSLNVDTYTGDGSFTMKTLTVTPASINYTLLAIGGVFQPRSAYSVAGAVITFSDPPPNGAIVEVTTIVAGAAGAGGGGASVLDDLTDVTITSPANNQVLKYNGSAWVNGAGAASWTYSAVSANTSAVAGYRYIVDTATANLTITLPASGTLGDEVMIIDGTGNASTHAITVGRNGGNIAGSASNMTVTTDRAAFTLVYYNNTQGWLLTNV